MLAVDLFLQQCRRVKPNNDGDADLVIYSCLSAHHRSLLFYLGRLDGSSARFPHSMLFPGAAKGSAQQGLWPGATRAAAVFHELSTRLDIHVRRHCIYTNVPMCCARSHGAAVRVCTSPVATAFRATRIIARSTALPDFFISAPQSTLLGASTALSLFGCFLDNNLELCLLFQAMHAPPLLRLAHGGRPANNAHPHVLV